jgi:hypothetical protein
MAGPKVIKRVKASKGKLSGVFDSGAQFVDHRIGWDKLPRHYPELGPSVGKMANAFAPWPAVA